jgi:hypothetical protein
MPHEFRQPVMAFQQLVEGQEIVVGDSGPQMLLRSFLGATDESRLYASREQQADRLIIRRFLHETVADRAAETVGVGRIARADAQLDLIPREMDLSTLLAYRLYGYDPVSPPDTSFLL